MPGVAGTWKDLTDSVNMMASNLTNQVRGIAKVVTAVATGNLKQKLSIVSRGEVAQLIDTINEMIDTLAVFADPNCGFCKRMERDLASMTDVTIYTFLYPILDPTTNGDSMRKSKAIWCASVAKIVMRCRRSSRCCGSGISASICSLRTTEHNSRRP